MTIFVNFTLGPKEAYFFNSPTHWAWHNLPPDVEALFTKTPPLKDVLEFALGAQGTYFISYRDHDGQIFCRHYNLPNPLVEYLYASNPAVIRDLTSLSISLGPYESYYAHDRTSASWSNLPPTLEKAILGRLVTQDMQKTTWKDGGREAPSFVSLGDDGSYFMRTVAGGGSWDLKSKADGMVGTNKFLDESPNFQNIAGLYLFPTSPNSYVLLLTSGKAFSNLPEHTWPDYNKMAPSLPITLQTPAPIPPVPQPRAQAQAPAQQPRPQSQPQFQPQQQFQQQQPFQPQQQFQPQQPFQQQRHSGCCPSGIVAVQPIPNHNCWGGPLPAPYMNRSPVVYYAPQQMNSGAVYLSQNGQSLGVVHPQSPTHPPNQGQYGPGPGQAPRYG